jgi:hypothetical protein
MLMSDRQYAQPLVIRGLGDKKGEGQASHLRRLVLEGDNRKLFNEEWFQDLLYRFPSLLPAAEIEPAFESLEPIAKELPIAGKYADLLLVNPEGYIALVETKLIRNPEAKREVIAQTLDYACEMSGWTYAQLVQAVKERTKSAEADPLLHIIRKAAGDENSFNENQFIENVTRNLRKGRFLLLVVGDEITAEAERMVEFIQRTPHLHFTLGLVELSLFHEKEGNIDPLFVQPRLVAKTELHPRIVIDISLADGIQMKSQIKHESPTHVMRKTISSEEFFEQLKKLSLKAYDLAEWALAHAKEHQLTVDWGTGGPSLKYEANGAIFNFGQLQKYGGFDTTFWVPRFTRLGLPQDVALGYLDDIIRLVPESYRKEIGFEHDIKAQKILYGEDGDLLPLEKLAPQREQWFAAIDKAIEGITKARGEG